MYLKSRLAAGILSAMVSGSFASSPATDLFVTDRPQPLIYHEGWIDLNKNGRRDPFEDSTLNVEARLDDLIARMSLEEKTAQMVTLYGFSRVLKDELPTEAWRRSEWKDGVGNIDEHANGNESAGLLQPRYAYPWIQHVRLLNEVQRFFIEDTRLGIPADFTNEGIRGLAHTKATSFPAQLAVGSTWDKDLVYQIGQVTGREGRALGYTNIYSPILDLARDPRWGRTIDCYSEDPFLIAEYGIRQAKGIQEQGVASTLKHFAVYSIPKGGRDGQARTDPQASWNEVQTIHLYPFRRVIQEAHPLGVLVAYNDYDGVPIEASKLFLTDILRTEYGFAGYTVSDSKAVEFIHRKHRVAETYPEAIRQAVEAGLDVRTDFTLPEVYVNPLRELVKTGQLPMATIDLRVREILRVKFQLGLFDHPYRTDATEVDRVVRSPAHLATAHQAAREAIVLLKNTDNLLPLQKQKLRRVLVTGPMADNAQGWKNRYGPQRLEFVTVLAGLTKKLGPGCAVIYQRGCAVVDANYPESDVLKDSPPAEVAQDIAAAAAAAKTADVAIVVVGETDEQCSESHSRLSLDLPGYQNELVRAIHATGTPMVLVLSNGRPLSINWAARHVPAIVEMWLPGEEGGDALADVLLGDFNPSGRLPITFPKSVGQVPWNFPARPGSQAPDLGEITGSLYPFGHGLSYTTFAYSHLRVTPEQQDPHGTVAVDCDVTNTGERPGAAVVQLYLRDDYSSVVSFDRMLRGFERLELAPHETKTAHFTLTPAALVLFDRNRHWVVEPGRFSVYIGESAEDTKLEGSFVITSGAVPPVAPPPEQHADPR